MDVNEHWEIQIKAKEQLKVRKDMDVNEQNYRTLHLRHKLK